MPDIKHAMTCPAEGCESIVFYDWGLEVLSLEPTESVAGGPIETAENFAKRNSVKVCARCLTPYVHEWGKLLDLSEHIDSEEIERIIQRGRGSLPLAPVRDP